MRTLVATGTSEQSVTVGYNFSEGATAHGFAAVSASLSGLGARTDVAPLPTLGPTSEVQLRVFVGKTLCRLAGNFQHTYCKRDSIDMAAMWLCARQTATWWRRFLAGMQ